MAFSATPGWLTRGRFKSAGRVPVWSASQGTTCRRLSDPLLKLCQKRAKLILCGVRHVPPKADETIQWIVSSAASLATLGEGQAFLVSRPFAIATDLAKKC